MSTDNNSSSFEKVTLNSIITNGQCQMNHTENVRSVDIFDLKGRKLSEIKTNGQVQLSLDFSNFSKGMYLVVAHAAKFEKKTFKVLVKKRF